MDIKFLEIAEIELDEAIEFYNHQLTGLGNQFLTEVLDTIERISVFPNAWHLCSPNTRQCRMKRFPYKVIYQVLNDEILVVAIAHLHREPNYWKNRILH
jgi:mRNA-degrading endonuclease RelE of RelBE toxin-antitoxin system